ncbi:hypothetical protein AVEN_31341-1 [Araneus ventricosus]|uniref:Uncharacterized protein n=1 Tax=Araneus ventricosus TaxID=182803 RepID=A0A4Y2KDQ9_ARAVE|nr:hypothetical protein AVEN_31341-1 [Araneus ventricosus]
MSVEVGNHVVAFDSVYHVELLGSGDISSKISRDAVVWGKSSIREIAPQMVMLFSSDSAPSSHLGHSEIPHGSVSAPEAQQWMPKSPMGTSENKLNRKSFYAEEFQKAKKIPKK